MKNEILTKLQEANDALDMLQDELMKMRDRLYWDFDRANEINEEMYEEHKILTNICDNHLSPAMNLTYSILTQLKEA